MAPRITPYGDRGLLVELGGLDEVAAWAAAVRAAMVDGVVEGVLDVVPAARSVLLHLTAAGQAAHVERAVAGLEPKTAAGRSGEWEPFGPPEPVVIPVTYDGPDLADVAAATGLTPAEVVQAHVRSAWRVGFAGFAPGFAYLVGGDERLDVARRATPRTTVPAGAVALAGGYSAVYPRASPGGWQLIGHTDLALWVVDRDPPALLTPGGAVRFVQAGR